MATDGDRFRLAIALAALKSKPESQSIHSYILDLQGRFAPSVPGAPTSDGSWRIHALELEKEVADLKEKYEAEQIRSLAMAAASSNISATDLPPSSIEAPTTSNKKKTKKKSAQAQSKRLVINPLKSILEGQQDVSSIEDTNHLFSSFNVFQDLVTSLPRTLSKNQSTLLTSTVTRTLDALSGVLVSILKNALNTRTDILKTLALLLDHLFSTTALFMSPKGTVQNDSDEIDLIIDRTNSLILYPIIHSLAGLSEMFINAVFFPSPSPAKNDSQSQPSDIRPDMLHLFCSTYESLNPLKSKSDLRNYLILESVRHLVEILPLPDRVVLESDSTKSTPTRQQRTLRRLARKDSIWYICAILTALMSTSHDDNPIPPSTDPVLDAGSANVPILEQGILDSLCSVLSRCGSSQRSSGLVDELTETENDKNNKESVAPLDEMEHEIILAMIERYWGFAGGGF